jgi:hypothetical protein
MTSAVLAWQVTGELAAPGTKFWTFNSPDGVTGWQIQNPDSPVIWPNQQTTVPVALAAHDLTVLHFRVLAETATGQLVPSPAIGLFETVARHEYGVAHAIIKQEYLQMRVGDGLEYWLYVPLMSGKRAKGVDPDTGQQMTAECPEDTSEGVGYGQLYAGGFGPPLLTMARQIGAAKMTNKDDENLSASQTSWEQQMRFLAFPRPQRGYLLVSRKTDDRYVVGEDIQPLMFKSSVPIAYEGTVSKIERNDPRHKLRTPDQQDL